MRQADRRLLYAVIVIVMILLLWNVLRPAEVRFPGSSRGLVFLVGLALVIWALSRQRRVR